MSIKSRKKQEDINPLRNALRSFLLVLVVIVVYAVAVESTQIDLELATRPARQDTFIRVLRMMASPDIFAVDPETSAITGFSSTMEITYERMLETILMALLASTIGVALAVPLSFLGARNVMGEVRMPVAGITGALIGLPIGAGIFSWLANGMMGYSAQLSTNSWIGLGSLAGAVALSWLIMYMGQSIMTPTRPSPKTIASFLARLTVVALLLFFALGVFAHLGLVWGRWLQGQLGPYQIGIFTLSFGFIGNFIFVLSDFVRLVGPPFMALIGGLIAASLGSRYGQEAIMKLAGFPARLVAAAIAFFGVGVAIYGIGSGLNWLYLFDQPENWTTIPALIGGSIAALISLGVDPKRPFPIGIIVYGIARTIFNTLRSIETLIMAIVFVIWVGLGPFAGLMALALHSIAALSKLFSEQVESISSGPVEAITATGANKLQTIAFAIVPQIIPPYIAFSFYRWDINVRMSTIIGFVGGGGIGFVLKQQIDLLRYPQASVMMIAIALVVASLDYLSSNIRKKII
ncbi:MAG: ABC transporter permease subunit [Chloroflexota bacterium]|jgi:phosphonate ABC transporter permease subunit PhnE